MADQPRAAPSPVIVWRAQPGPQSALISCPVFEVFFGGARGGGKTDGMLGDWVAHAARYGPNAIGLMLRRERTQLVETIERSREIYTPIGAKFHEQDKMWRFPDGARLRFAYLERDADAEAYQGHSYTRIYVEELTNFPDQKPILKLMATLRSGAGVPVGFRATGNPGGPGHNWVKARYIDPAPGGWEILTDAASGLQRVYIPSRVGDNRFLGSDYVARLRASGNDNLVRAWLEGDWSVIDGAFFDRWSTERHVVRPFVIPPDWLRFRAMDWGFAKPFCVQWFAVADGMPVHGYPRPIPRGTCIMYREWYGSNGEPNVGLRLTAEEIAAGIVQREAGEKVTYGVLDPAAFSMDGGPSHAERMRRAGVSFRPADNKRVGTLGAIGGWDQVRARLNGDDETPGLLVFDTCKATIRTVPVLQHNPDRAEDIDTKAEDHAADTLRYGMMSRPYVPREVPDKPADRTIMMVTPEGRLQTNTTARDFALRKERQRRLSA